MKEYISVFYTKPENIPTKVKGESEDYTPQLHLFITYFSGTWFFS